MKDFIHSKNKFLRASVLAGIIATLALLAILLTALAQKHSRALLSTPPEKPQISAQFSLMDENGQPVTQADFTAPFQLVYFGFSFCPDICPMQLQVMGAALDKIENTHSTQARNITPLFISLDPARDTPKILRQYTDLFHPRLIGLTGSQKQIAQAAKNFKIYFAHVQDQTSAAGYTVDHASIVYLLGADKKFLAAYTHRDTPESMAASLAQHITARN